jgi:AcrR family transcriptional regulator
MHGEGAVTVAQDRQPAGRKGGAPLRRVPVQERSAARVQRMLDACAELVDELGYDGLSTTLLAERAGVAIGSVYQFFPDKRAVVQAVTVRNLETYLQRISRRFTEGGLQHWWDGVDAVIDEYVEMQRGTPGFRGLHFGDIVDTHLLDEHRDNNDVIVGKLRDVLAERFDLVADERLDFALTIAVETGDALIKLAFRRTPDGDPAVIAEAKALIRQYLAGYVTA